MNELDLEHPEENKIYEELSPLLGKIHKQNRQIQKQLELAKQQQEEFSLITENMQEGLIVIDKEEYDGDADELMMQALDAGAEDFAEEEDSFEILTGSDDFSDVRQALEDAGVPMAAAEVTMIPQTYVELTDETDIKNIQKTLDMLDDDDDVQNVYHNWDE